DTRPGTHVSADLSAIAATGRVSGTFAKGRGTWSLAGRRTYVDAVVTAFTDNVLPYHFQDFHGHATYALRGNWRLSMTGYGGRDVLNADFAALSTNPDSIPSRASEGDWRVDWGNHVFGASLSKEIPAAARVPLFGWHLR